MHGAMPDHPDPADRPPVLIPMPQGLGVNGVVRWALRLAGALAGRGWPVGLVLHPEPAHYPSAGHLVPPGVRAFDLRRWPPLDAPGRGLSPFVAAYRDALAELGASPRRPAVLLPNLDAGAFAIAAALGAAHGDHLRTIGWQHSDTAFDAALLATYEPVLAAMVGVSDHIAGQLRQRLPWRAGDVHHIPYGVEVAAPPPERRPGPIRLLYAGRLEHEQKRVGVLLALAGLLHERGVPGELRLVGDGPAAAQVEGALAGLPRATRWPAADGDQMLEHLRWADALVLASRYEGLSIAMLEAMAMGVVPIVTRVRSGADEAIGPGREGLLIDPHGDDAAVAARLADAIAALDAPALATMRQAAHARAARHYALPTHADACARLLARCVAGPGRWWPLERPCVFGAGGPAAPGAVHGSVPPDAAERAAAAIATIDGPLAVYGAGRHTLAIAPVLASARVACVLDDDPRNHGNTLWGWPIVGPPRCPPHAAVLLSSYLHRHDMARRCEREGLRWIDPYA